MTTQGIPIEILTAARSGRDSRRAEFFPGHKPLQKRPASADNHGRMMNFLLASLIWGTIGTGYALYGKKQGASVPLAGGLALIGCSYFITSALLLSLVSIGLIVGMHWLMRRGF